MTKNLEEILIFGKHRGLHVEDVPASYLLWMRENEIDDKYPAIKKYISKNFKALEEEVLVAKEEREDLRNSGFDY